MKKQINLESFIPRNTDTENLFVSCHKVIVSDHSVEDKIVMLTGLLPEHVREKFNKKSDVQEFVQVITSTISSQEQFLKRQEENYIGREKISKDISGLQIIKDFILSNEVNFSYLNNKINTWKQEIAVLLGDEDFIWKDMRIQDYETKDTLYDINFLLENEGQYKEDRKFIEKTKCYTERIQSAIDRVQLIINKKFIVSDTTSETIYKNLVGLPFDITLLKKIESYSSIGITDLSTQESKQSDRGVGSTNTMLGMPRHFPLVQDTYNILSNMYEEDIHPLQDILVDNKTDTLYIYIRKYNATLVVSNTYGLGTNLYSGGLIPEEDIKTMSKNLLGEKRNGTLYSIGKDDDFGAYSRLLDRVKKGLHDLTAPGDGVHNEILKENILPVQTQKNIFSGYYQDLKNYNSDIEMGVSYDNVLITKIDPEKNKIYVQIGKFNGETQRGFISTHMWSPNINKLQKGDRISVKLEEIFESTGHKRFAYMSETI